MCLLCIAMTACRSVDDQASQTTAQHADVLDVTNQPTRELPEGAQPQNSLQHIRLTSRLPGIAELNTTADGGVELVKSTEGRGRGRMLLGPGFRSPVDQTQLQPGQTASWTDGRHANTQYEFVSAQGDDLLFRVTDIFDARSFGDGVTSTSWTVRLKPYPAP
jgi:hypothetical protein